MPEHKDARKHGPISLDLGHQHQLDFNYMGCRDIAMANNERQLRHFNLWSGRLAEQQGAVEAL